MRRNEKNCPGRLNSKEILVNGDETKSYVRKAYYKLSVVGQSRRKEMLIQNHMKPSGLLQLVRTCWQHRKRMILPSP